jgi:hypothetical protein
MIRIAFLIAALTATVGCSASALTGETSVEPTLAAAAGEPGRLDAAEYAAAPSYQPYVTCDVVARTTRNGVRIEALAHAGDGVVDTIDYELTVTRDGGGGSSDIVQSGAADLVAGETVTLGVAEFNLERRARYRADLVLSDEDGVICNAELES